MSEPPPISPNEADLPAWANKLLAAWNVHDSEQILAFYADDYTGVDISEMALRHGLMGVQQQVNRYLRAFPDLHITADAWVAQSNRVALTWTAQGTHQGELMNIPPTGRHVQVRGMSMLTVRNGKISHAFCLWDVAGLLRSIGLLPEL